MLSEGLVVSGPLESLFKPQNLVLELKLYLFLLAHLLDPAVIEVADHVCMLSLALAQLILELLHHRAQVLLVDACGSRFIGHLIEQLVYAELVQTLRKKGLLARR